MKRDRSNQKKYEKLGMPFGTANGRLKKNVMFDLVCKLRLNLCFHCNMEITNVDHFSIEHKVPWLNSDNPVELFFDLNNIAFSHLVCNVEAGAKIIKVYDNAKELNKAMYAKEKADPVRYQLKLARKREAWRRGGGHK